MPMKHITFAAALLLAACATAPEARADCPPAGYSRAQLEALKASDWTVADDAARNRLARAMTECLASPDPALRDALAFEALQHWMRAHQLSDAAMLAIDDDLQARLTAPEGPGFERPFAALVLAEVARADRMQAYLTPARRASLLDASIAYLPVGGRYETPVVRSVGLADIAGCCARLSEQNRENHRAVSRGRLNRCACTDAGAKAQ